MSRSECQHIHDGCSTELAKLKQHFEAGGLLCEKDGLKKRFNTLDKELKGSIDARGHIKDVITRDRLKEIRHNIGILTTDCNRLISRARKSSSEQHISQSA